MEDAAHNQMVSLIWNIADDVLRDVFLRGRYRDVILPMIVLRRLDAKAEVDAEAANASTYGAKMPRVSADYMANLRISLPPLPEQEQIVKRRQIVVDEAVRGGASRTRGPAKPGGRRQRQRRRVMGRLPGFDYKRPFFYMVTLKRVRVLQPPASAGGMGVAQTRGAAKPLPFCAISEAGKVVANAITEAFEAAIREWARFWRSVESVWPYVIMPDHLHLLIKLAAVEKAVSLAVVVGDLRKRLNRAYWQVLQPPASAGGNAPRGREALQDPVLQGGASAPPVFEFDWHDWIVKKEGQLAAFRTYILENPPRYARRRANRRFFTQARQIEWRGARYWAYGNEALLELPMIVAIKGHRRGMGAADAAPCKTSAAGLMAAASRIGPGGAGFPPSSLRSKKTRATPSSQRAGR